MRATKVFFEELRRKVRRNEFFVQTPPLVEVACEDKDNQMGWEDLLKENEKYKEENAQLKKRVNELEAFFDIPDVEPEMTVEEYEQMQAWQEEMARKEGALQQVDELMAQVQTLKSLLESRDDGEERLPITVFIQYVEDHFQPEQNERAKIIKEVLYDVFSLSNVSQEIKERLRKLGFKPKPTSSVTISGPLNDIHDNEHVKAGL